MSTYRKIGLPSPSRSFAQAGSPPPPPPVPAEHDECLTPAIRRVLQRTPVAQWSAYSVLLDSEAGEMQLMTRGELAGWLRANDLPTLAAEAASRRVPFGGLLLLVLGSEGPRFHVLGKRGRP